LAVTLVGFLVVNYYGNELGQARILEPIDAAGLTGGAVAGENSRLVSERIARATCWSGISPSTASSTRYRSGPTGGKTLSGASLERAMRVFTILLLSQWGHAPPKRALQKTIWSACG